MTKKIRIILVSIVTVILIGYTVYANKAPQEKSEVTLWSLVDQMDWLRNLKEECADNLGIADSARFLQWYTWYCDSWDAEIIELRNQINQLQKKDYEGLVRSR